MFTGLVQAVGRVVAIGPGVAGSRHGTGADGVVRLVVDPGSWTHVPAPGDSISVSGVCLTVVDAGVAQGRGWAFDVVAETLAKTHLGTLKSGDRVNLEHAVTPATLMGGHFVQGHVDGVGIVDAVLRGDDWRVRIRPEPGLMKYMTPKGSVCLDGVSLTLAEVDKLGGTIAVALIPATLERTTLRDWATGGRVNIEADVLVKTIVAHLESMAAACGLDLQHPR